MKPLPIDPPHNPLSWYTRRQCQVLEAVKAQGSVRRAAESLDCSITNVAKHLQRMHKRADTMRKVLML